jgi:hypothetical protein
MQVWLHGMEKKGHGMQKRKSYYAIIAVEAVCVEFLWQLQ